MNALIYCLMPTLIIQLASAQETPQIPSLSDLFTDPNSLFVEENSTTTIEQREEEFYEELFERFSTLPDEMRNEIIDFLNF